MQLEPTQIYEVADEKIFVFDNVVPPNDIERFCRTLRNSSFTFLHASRKDTEYQREWAAEFDVKDFVGHSLHDYAHAAAVAFMPSTPLVCSDAFCNASTFGDMTFIHHDSTKLGNISTLYYANETWDAEWGGETLFFDDNRDARIAVGVQPGRLIVFSGQLLHRAGTPTKACPEVRLTMSVRFEKGPTT